MRYINKLTQIYKNRTTFAVQYQCQRLTTTAVKILHIDLKASFAWKIKFAHPWMFQLLQLP